MRITLWMITIMTTIFGCGKSDDSDPDSDKKGNGSPTPGTYAFITKDISYTCTDGGSGSVPSLSKNVELAISGNQLNITAALGDSSSSQAEAAGISMKASGYSGLFKKDGSFSATQTGSGTSDQQGAMVISYHLEGFFTSAGWNGDYSYTILFSDYSVSCDYKTSFSGEKQ
jgi:hypothetical protein